MRQHKEKSQLNQGKEKNSKQVIELEIEEQICKTTIKFKYSEKATKISTFYLTLEIKPVLEFKIWRLRVITDKISW